MVGPYVYQILIASLSSQFCLEWPEKKNLKPWSFIHRVAGALVIMIEAPCCCLFIDFVQNVSDWMEKRPYWNRAAVYCV